MMRRAYDAARRKLSSRQGDSMVEALAAILIAVLGATMLATMVMASVSVTSRSERELSGAYAAEASLYGNGAPGKVAVVIPDGFSDWNGFEVNVTLFSSGEYSSYLTDDQSANAGVGGS